MTLPVVVTGQMMSAANWNAWVVDNMNYLLGKVDALFPVGSILISVSPTNPGTSLGFGTWAAFGTGRTLVGIDTGQTEFDVVEETGGAKTHTLSTAEMPAHTHNVSLPNSSSSVAAGGTSVPSMATSSYATSSAGSGGAHNNLQPYIVVYMWKRTA
ncbi:MAG: hypothetical protein HY863_15810 [Chloroflexi bacterium]|nr:hypothetical protein [Chloroflexota bacterium]